jgi:hypothetical protein
VAIHENMHAVLGYGEHEATRAEQRFSGKIFGVSRLVYNRRDMRDAVHVASMAQGQREVDVIRRHRKPASERTFLKSIGFTPRMARRILEAGTDIGRRMLKVREIRDAAKSFGKQYIYELPDDINGVIEKTVTDEFNVILKASIGDQEILKEFGSTEDLGLQGVDGFHSRGADDGVVIESAVRESIDLGIGRDLRMPQGIVPALRRASFDVSQLSQTQQDLRTAALLELAADAAREGLYDELGNKTDCHVLMLMHGYSPNLEEMKGNHHNDRNQSASEG